MKMETGRKLTLRARLWLGLGSMIVLASAGGVTSAVLTGRAQHATTQLIDGPVAEHNAAEGAQVAMLQARRSEKDFLMRRDPAYLEKVDAAVAKVQENLATIGQVSPSAERRAGAEVTAEYLSAYQTLFHEMATLQIERGLSEEQGLEGELRAAVHTVETDLKDSGHDALTVLMLMCRRHEKDYLMRGDPKYLGRIDERLAEFDQAVAGLNIDKQQADNWRKNWAAYRAAMGRIAEIDARIAEQTRAFREATHRVEGELEEIATGAEADTAQSQEQVQAQLVTTVRIALGVIGLMVLLGVAAALVLVRSIARPIRALAERAAQIADSDLTHPPLTVQTRDEIGTLADATNRMQASLRELVSAIQKSSNDVASAATEISASAEETATGMDEQNRQIEQITAAVDELSASIGEVASQSARAADQATRSGQAADQGAKVVQQTVQDIALIDEAVTAGSQSVSRLGERSEQIGQVIEVINDIADQTNLLALNAAIEAARAGEHGRGFAVVADEVRKLADRTTQATQEVTESIMAIQTDTQDAVQRMRQGAERVRSGVERAQEAGQSLGSIRQGAEDVGAGVRSIAAAVEEQSAASDQIQSGVQQVNAMSRQATEAARQSAQAVTSLSRKAEELLQLTERFRV